MKKISNYIYALKIILFVINFYFVFMMLHNILDTKIYGFIFIGTYLIFSIKIIVEFLSQKVKYKDDIIYNSMQIGFMLYLIFISAKITISKIYVTRITVNYFKTNFLILSILIIFILIYSLLENSSQKNVKQR